MVEKMLANDSFYPEKSEEDRKSTAWAIAYSDYNKNKKRKSNSFNMKEYRTAKNQT